jgi:hypothetical protein
MNDLKLESLLSDVNKGVVPDFGFLNELKFGDDHIGWHLFIDIIATYPKY